MIDTNQVGAMVVSEDPHMEEWKDQSTDIYKIKMRERYGFALYNQGQGISIARNISVEPNALVLPPQATISGLAPIVQKP